MTEEFRERNILSGLDRLNHSGWGGIQVFRQIKKLKKSWFRRKEHTKWERMGTFLCYLNTYISLQPIPSIMSKKNICVTNCTGSSGNIPLPPPDPPIPSHWQILLCILCSTWGVLFCSFP